MNKNRRKEIALVQDALRRVNEKLDALIDECVDADEYDIASTLRVVQDDLMSADTYLDEARN
jgi:hypothetical protein